MRLMQVSTVRKKLPPQLFSCLPAEDVMFQSTGGLPLGGFFWYGKDKAIIYISHEGVERSKRFKILPLRKTKPRSSQGLEKLSHIRFCNSLFTQRNLKIKKSSFLSGHINQNCPIQSLTIMYSPFPKMNFISF